MCAHRASRRRATQELAQVCSGLHRPGVCECPQTHFSERVPSLGGT